MQYASIPDKNDIAGWVRLLDEAAYMEPEYLVSIHNQLHSTFGSEPNDALLPGEQRLSMIMRSLGLEHRHKDDLAQAAGTLVESPRPATMREVQFYLHSMPIHSGVVQLCQNAEGKGPVYIKMDDSSLPPGMAAVVLRQINKQLPPGVNLRTLPQRPREEFVAVQSAYDLMMYHDHAMGMFPPTVIPGSQIAEQAPKGIFKSDDSKLRVDFTVAECTEAVHKAEDGRPERFVLGPVLIPETEDKQGEIYSKEEVRKACHWWAENSGVLSHHHVLQGGRFLNEDSMQMLENYVLPCDADINGVTLKAGTWMLGVRVHDDVVWNEMVTGKLKGWSIGAEALTWWEEVPEGA
jgi:hypothetical protein